jgi:hypothetical protein
MTATMLVLEPIFEADLPPEQYAYRPGVWICRRPNPQVDYSYSHRLFHRSQPKPFRSVGSRAGAPVWPGDPDPHHVSSPLHVARNVRISRIARPHLLHAKAYGTRIALAALAGRHGSCAG